MSCSSRTASGRASRACTCWQGITQASYPCPMRIAILGAGKIGESLLAGLHSSGWTDVVVTTRREERAAELRDRYAVEATTANAAAIPTAVIERQIAADVPVVRAMPNAPSTVHEGIAGICAGAHAGREHLERAAQVLRAVGGVVEVAEPYMDAVTAVSGSGPAYFALLAEAMIEAGILLGLSREVSTELVVQTMFGTAKLLRDEKMHPGELREAVTSPGGTTTRAIRELEQAGVRAAFLNAINAAMERSQELARGHG